MLGCPASSGCECQLSSGTDSGGNSGATFEMARVISSISSPRAVACAVNIAERRKCERSDPRQRVHDHGTVCGAGPAETVQQTGNPQAAQCLLQIDPVRRQQDRHHVHHQLGQHTSAREGYRASEARVGPNADQQFGQRRLHHPFDEESVGYRASVPPRCATLPSHQQRNHRAPEYRRAAVESWPGARRWSSRSRKRRLGGRPTHPNHSPDFLRLRCRHPQRRRLRQQPHHMSRQPFRARTRIRPAPWHEPPPSRVGSASAAARATPRRR